MTLREQASARLSPAVMEELARQCGLGRTGLYDALRQPILDTLQPLFDQMAREIERLGDNWQTCADNTTEALDWVVQLTRERDDLRAKLTQAESRHAAFRAHLVSERAEWHNEAKQGGAVNRQFAREIRKHLDAILAALDRSVTT